MVQFLLKSQALIIMKLFYPLLPTFLKLTCIAITIAHSLGQVDLNVQCIKSEEDALLHFKKGFKSPSTSNLLSSWDPAIDCCKWKGVGCNTTTGHVISLNLRTTNSSERLSGELSLSLLNLSWLSSLDLSGNDFMQTEVPEFVGSLHNLEHLNLSGTNIRGNLPYHLGNLSHMQSLDLSDNRFSLAVNNLDWLYGLSFLEKLDLSKVQVINTENWLDAVNALPFLVELRLSACQLHKIPFHLPYVNITSLQILDLSSNDFYGLVPNWLFEIGDIEYLDLGDNELYGQIPDEFEHLESLVFLNLGDNKLWGQIPNKFENLESLAILDLSNNNLSGSMPTALGKIYSQNELVRQSSLKELYLSGNYLCERLEESLLHFSSLEVLDVSGNDFEGILMDSHLDNLRSLRVLDLSSNHLRLNVSENWIPPFQLEHIGFRSVQVGPRFPNWLQSQKKFLYFDLSHDNISGSVPDWFWHLSSVVEYMNLSYNNLGGCMHDFSLNFNLDTLDLSVNSFHCPLPHFPPAIKTLKLFKNSFYGSMSHVCEILGVNNSLSCLDLSKNDLSGDIPDCWEHGKSLIFLYLEDNNLSGHIPDSFAGLESLALLDLRSNHLAGEIPASLQKCSALSFLFLSNNRLSGEIPTWIGESLQHLEVLILGSNALGGNIPVQLCQLKLLRILDLSGNHLSGAIPGCVFNAMTTTDPIPTDIYDPYNTCREIFLTVHWACNEKIGVLSLSICGQYNSLDTYVMLNMLDLSSNSLTGEIPEEITRHVGLVSLNLSSNQLVGSIPSDIGNMTSMEALDLSRNRLTCSIPTSMINLSFLSLLNVSYNNLAGKIPSENQFQTFDASAFLGNDNLCGPPLARSCSTNESYEDQHCKHSEEHEGQEDDTMNWLETPSFYISMVLGFITGFWAFWGPLILSTSWRHSYFRFLDRMTDYIYVTIAVTAAKLRRKHLSQEV